MTRRATRRADAALALHRGPARPPRGDPRARRRLRGGAGRRLAHRRRRDRQRHPGRATTHVSSQDVVLYVAIGVVAWVLGTATWLMLAGVGQRMVLDLRRDLFEHLTSLSLRYFSQQKAGWIIARLTSDVDALSDVLNQGLTTLVVNTLTLVAAIGGLFLLDWRLGLVALLVLPPGMLDHALVPAHVARGVLRRPHADRGGDGAARRVGRRHGGRAGLQPRARLPAGVRGPERGEPAVEHLRAEALVGVLPGDRAARRDRAGRRDLRRRADDRRRRARDRHAHRRGRHALSSSSSRCRSSPSSTGRCRPRARRWARSRPSSTPSRTSPTGPDAARAPADRRPSRARRRRVRVRRGAGDPRARARHPAGGCIALVGESGGGKSTTAKLDRPLLRPATRAPSASTASTCGTSASARTAASSASCSRTRSSSAGRSPTTSASRGPRRPTRRSRPPPGRSASTGSPRGSRRASTTSSARAAPACRRASAS